MGNASGGKQGQPMEPHVVFNKRIIIVSAYLAPILTAEGWEWLPEHSKWVWRRVGYGPEADIVINRFTAMAMHEIRQTYPGAFSLYTHGDAPEVWRIGWFGDETNFLDGVGECECEAVFAAFNILREKRFSVLTSKPSEN